MKRTGKYTVYIGIAALVVLGLVAAVFGYKAYTAGRQADVAPTQQGTATPEAANLEGVIWASGKLLPARWAGLSPAAAGTVSTIRAAEGDQVEAGAILLELDNSVLKSQVAAAAAAVAEAEAAQARLLAGATPAQQAAAHAEVAAAQAGVELAQAGLEEAKQAIEAAKAQVNIARAQYAELASHPMPAELTEAQRQVEVAAAALSQAQAAYNLVKGDVNIGLMPQALALQQATAGLDAAKAGYTVAAQGATQQQLAVARAQIGASEAGVNSAQAALPAAEARTHSAQAALDAAQAALDGLLAGATAEDRAAAAARVDTAKAALASAEAQVNQTRVIAPFAGQVGTILVRPGELATPGQPVLMLGDTSQMQVETTDLRETDVTRLKTSMPVEVTFDALPGRTFQGAIARIAPMSTVEKGSTNYTVVVKVDDLDPSLRWGMTAFVNIRPQ